MAIRIFHSIGNGFKRLKRGIGGFFSSIGRGFKKVFTRKKAQKKHDIISDVRSEVDLAFRAKSSAKEVLQLEKTHQRLEKESYTVEAIAEALHSSISIETEEQKNLREKEERILRENILKAAAEDGGETITQEEIQKHVAAVEDSTPNVLKDLENRRSSLIKQRSDTFLQIEEKRKQRENQIKLAKYQRRIKNGETLKDEELFDYNILKAPLVNAIFKRNFQMSNELKLTQYKQRQLQGELLNEDENWEYQDLLAKNEKLQAFEYLKEQEKSLSEHEEAEYESLKEFFLPANSHFKLSRNPSAPEYKGEIISYIQEEKKLIPVTEATAKAEELERLKKLLHVNIICDREPWEIKEEKNSAILNSPRKTNTLEILSELTLTPDKTSKKIGKNIKHINSTLEVNNKRRQKFTALKYMIDDYRDLQTRYKDLLTLKYALNQTLLHQENNQQQIFELLVTTEKKIENLNAAIVKMKITILERSPQLLTDIKRIQQHIKRNKKRNAYYSYIAKTEKIEAILYFLESLTKGESALGKFDEKIIKIHAKLNGESISSMIIHQKKQALQDLIQAIAEQDREIHHQHIQLHKNVYLAERELEKTVTQVTLTSKIDSLNLFSSLQSCNQKAIKNLKETLKKAHIANKEMQKRQLSYNRLDAFLSQYVVFDSQNPRLSMIQETIMSLLKKKRGKLKDLELTILENAENIRDCLTMIHLAPQENIVDNTVLHNIIEGLKMMKVTDDNQTEMTKYALDLLSPLLHNESLSHLAANDESVSGLKKMAT